MVLLNYIIEELDLADHDIGVVLDTVAFNRRNVGAALVDCDFLRNAMPASGFVREV